MGTGVCGRWSHGVLSQEAERDEACVSSIPSFVSSLTSQPKGRRGSHLGRVFLLQLAQSGNFLTAKTEC